jgi:secondary thiamine-phosphate synthase enzyme
MHSTKSKKLLYYLNMLEKLTINTTKKREVIDITNIINDLLAKNIFYEGLCFINCSQTSCALATAEFDGQEASDDYIAAYESIMPKIQFKHSHDPNHFSDHFLSTLTGASLFIPVQSTSLVLGGQQKIVLIEFGGPAERRLTFCFLKEEVKMAL